MGVGFMLMATASLASAVTLRVDDATAQVGGSARVVVNLDNPEDDVRALQFSLGALPAGVQFAGAEASGRAAGLTADAEAQPDGTVKVVLISLGAETVAAGTGPVLDLHFAVHDTGSTSVPLMLTEVRVAGTAGALDATGQGGQLNAEGGSAAPASGGGCAIGPTRSGQPLWPVLVFAAALLIARSMRRADRRVGMKAKTLRRALVCMGTALAVALLTLPTASAGIDVSALFESGTVTVGTGVAGLAAAPDGSELYATKYGPYSTDSRGAVLILDPVGQRVLQTIDFDEPGFPWGLATAPDGRSLYVVVSKASGATVSSGRSRIEVIDVASRLIRATIPIGGNPYGPQLIAVTPDGTTGYVTHRGDGTVLRLALNTNSVAAAITTGGAPCGIAMRGDGKRAYVAPRNVGRLDIIDTDSASATYDRVLDSIPLGFAPVEMTTYVAATQDGTRVYVSYADVSFLQGNQEVAVVSPATRGVATIQTTGDNLGQVVLSPREDVALVASRPTNQILVLDTNPLSPTFHTQIGAVEVSAEPLAVAFNPRMDATVAYAVGDQTDVLSIIGQEVSAELRVGNAIAAPGQQRVAIPISLTNDVAVRALQFALSDVPDQVTLSASPVCSLTSRSSGLSCDCYQSGGVIRCVLLSTGGATIAAGSGQVATVFVDDTAPSCTAGQTIQLNLSETAVADASNNPVSHTTVNGSLRCGCPEDLNCDTHTDIFDALICVDLILGRNPARCADADLDANGRTDIFDCLLIVDTILGRRQSCSVPPITPGTATATAVRTSTRTATPTPSTPRTATATAAPWASATNTATGGVT
jgi:YVTN family beta-propeller protein